MAVFSGNVQVTLKTTSTGNLAAKSGADAKAVEGLKNQVAQTGEASSAASGKVKGFVDQVASVKSGAKPLNIIREGFENLRSNAGFLGAAIGGVVTVVSTLWELFSTETPIPQFILDAERAASAEYEFSKQLWQNVEAANASMKSLDNLRLSVLELASANAKARGDEKTSADLAKLKELGGISQGISGTKKSIEETFAQRQQLLKEGREAEARAKNLAAQSVAAQFEANQAGSKGDIAAWSRAAAASVQVDAAAALARWEAKTAFETAQKLTDQLGVQNAALEQQKESLRLAADTTIKIDETLIAPEKSRGGGGGSIVDDDEARRFWEDKRRRFGASADSREMTDGDFAAIERNIGRATGRDEAARSRAQMGNDIRDFASALSEALPGMAEFQGALSSIADTWAKWGQGSVNTKNAVVGSLGAIAKAGAAQIKNEKLRAGVLSIIELGLGFGSIAAYDYPAAAAHFTAAAILGTQALFSASGGGGKGGNAGSSKTVARQVANSGSSGSAPYVININAPWFGPSLQEAAAGLVQFLQRPHGTGFERGRDAA